MSTDPSFGRDLALLRARIAELEATAQQDRAKIERLEHSIKVFTRQASPTTTGESK